MFASAPSPRVGAGLPRAPICMLTANALPHFEAMALEAGAEGFLTKPVSAAALIQKIAQLAPQTDAGGPPH